LIASTSWAFFMEPAPRMPRPPAIDLRSARSREFRPPDLRLDVDEASAEPPDAPVPDGSTEVGSMVSVT
jgi:hypothetical protein